MYAMLRKALFCLDAERSHQLSLSLLAKLQASPLRGLLQQSITAQPVECMGLVFPHRLGLAAGFDKNGEYLDVFAAMGFAFIEVGTVTPKAQLGNESPRLFRLPEVESIINRMGFNNKGVDYLLEQIEKSHFQGRLGINIGKNKTTPIEYSQDDYLLCLAKVYPYADYITVNISSPNTPDLRSLQYGEVLEKLLVAIKNKQQQLQQQHNKRVPIAVKIAPDLTVTELTQMADSFIRHRVDAVIATNTTIDKQLIYGINNSQQMGGVSGRPLQNKSTQIIQLLSSYLQPHGIPIIGVGGINDLISAREKLQAGASLLQIYSGLIYHGPKLIKIIAENLS